MKNNLKSKTVPKIGIGVAICIAAFVALTLGALIIQAPSLNLAVIWQDSYFRHVTWFSFYQASISTLLSVIFAIPVAHSLFRRQFWGRSVLLKLLSSTLVLPVLVAVFGLLAVYGHQGILAKIYQTLNLHFSFSIYGLNGILLAHVFFNLPYASRLLLQVLDTIPLEQHQLCTHLGMSRWDKFKWIEWPRLRQQLPCVTGLVFMLCFTSFATVMALGGGPRATTIELAIYQAIKFDFDLQTGALLALWQILLCGGLTIALQKLAKPISIDHSTTSTMHYIKCIGYQMMDSWRGRIWDFMWIGAVILLVIPPLVMVVVSGLNSQLWVQLTSLSFWLALYHSLQIAICSSLLAVGAGCAVLWTSRAWRVNQKILSADSLDLIGTIILVTPGLVMSTGLFILLRNYFDVFNSALLIVVLVNGLMALPYVIKTLAQPMLYIEQQYQELCQSLGISGWQRFRIIEWRALRQPLAYAFAISFMLSFGDLSAIALFGSQEFNTLPLYLYQLLGGYQMQGAAVIAMILFLLSLVCFSIIGRCLVKRDSMIDTPHLKS